MFTPEEKALIVMALGAYMQERVRDEASDTALSFLDERITEIERKLDKDQLEQE